MGDRIDNIIGVKGIGCVKAAKLLEDKTPRQMWEVCVEHLGEERALENGRLLYTYAGSKRMSCGCPPEDRAGDHIRMKRSKKNVPKGL